MDAESTSTADHPDPHRLLLIVVGAHLHAELADRPLAYRLRDEAAAWQRRHRAGGALLPMVCTDLWYLNAEARMQRPTIAVGRPEHNAVSAYFANRLPSALVVDGRLQVQLDPQWPTLQACVWGVDDASTASGVDLFSERYLDGFLRCAHGLPAGPG